VNDVSAPEAVAAEERHRMIKNVKNVRQSRHSAKSKELGVDGGPETGDGGSSVTGQRSSVILSNSPRSAIIGLSQSPVTGRRSVSVRFAPCA
jgi:hypothetical protein